MKTKESQSGTEEAGNGGGGGKGVGCGGGGGTRGMDGSVGRASNWKARRSTDAGSSPCAARILFPQSRFTVQTFSWCPYSPRVQSHASTSMRTLTIPNTGSHSIVLTHENTAHTDRDG